MDTVDHVATDRWFVKRGVPHFMATYTAGEDVLTRALPVLTLAFLLSALAAIDLDWPRWGIALAVIGGLAVLLSAWALINTVRGRPRLDRPARVGRPKLVSS